MCDLITIPFRFSSIISFSLMSSFGRWNWNFAEIASPYSPYAWRVWQLQRCPKQNGAGIETWMQWWRFLLHMSTHLFFAVGISSNSILVHFVGRLIHTLQKIVNQWLTNYHINIKSSNILSLGSFFSQRRSLDILYPKTLEQVFEAKYAISGRNV